MSTRESKLHALNTAHLRTTRNSLRNPARQAAIEALDGLVACTADLSLAARQAHWNVRGRNFSALHALFGQISDDLNRQADVLAERSAALGGIPMCSPQSVASGTKLKPYPSFGCDGEEHIDELAERMAALGAELRRGVLDIEAHGDPVTAHLLIEACSAVDHLLWQLESHTPAEAPLKPQV